MRSRLIFVALLALLVLATPGCIGISWVGPERGTVSPPSVKIPGLLPADARPEGRATREQLLRNWGKPDRILRKRDGTEVWKYAGGPHLEGLRLRVLVPIPLLLPMGRETTEFLIQKNGEVVAGRFRGSKTRFKAAFGFTLPVGCTSDIFENEFRFEDDRPEHWPVAQRGRSER